MTEKLICHVCKGVLASNLVISRELTDNDVVFCQDEDCVMYGQPQIVGVVKKRMAAIDDKKPPKNGDGGG